MNCYVDDGALDLCIELYFFSHLHLASKCSCYGYATGGLCYENGLCLDGEDVRYIVNECMLM